MEQVDVWVHYCSINKLGESQIPNPKSQAEGPNIIYEGSKLPPRPIRERSFHLVHPLEEGAIGFAVIDHGVYDACNLGCDCDVSLSAQVGVTSVFRDVAFEFVPEVIGPLKNRGTLNMLVCN